MCNNEIKNEMPVIKASDYIYTVFVPTFQAELLFTIPLKELKQFCLSAMLEKHFCFLSIRKLYSIWKATCKIEIAYTGLFMFTRWYIMLAVDYLRNGENFWMKSFLPREKNRMKNVSFSSSFCDRDKKHSMGTNIGFPTKDKKTTCKKWKYFV